MLDFITKHILRRNIVSQDDVIASLPFSDYNDLYSKLQEKSKQSKVKTTLIFIFFALLNSLPNLQSKTVLNKFKNAENATDIYLLFKKHCKPSQSKKDALIDELYKIAPVLNNIYMNKKDVLETVFLSHIPNLEKKQDCFNSFKYILSILITDELSSKSVEYFTQKLNAFLYLAIKYQKEDAEYCINPNERLNETNIANNYIELKNVGREMLHEMVVLERYLYQYIHLCNCISCQGIFYSFKDLKILYNEKYAKLTPEAAIINQDFVSLIYENKVQKKYDQKDIRLLLDAFFNDENLLSPLCYFIYANYICQRFHFLEKSNTEFLSDMIKQLKSEDFLEAIIECRKQIMVVYDFLNLIWLNEISSLDKKDERFQQVFDSSHALWSNVYFKSLVLAHNNTCLGSIIEEIVHVLEQ